MTLRIATRGSALALTQTRWVAARLTERHPDLTTELVIIRTEGDRVQDRPLAAIGGRGVFVKAIEDALLAGEADLAVHSLKDMPSELPAGLVLAAIPEREDARDVLMLPGGATCEGLALPSGARVGTSGPRRRALLRRLRPDIEVAEIRGNLDTRLRKLDAGEYDALILAAAGLRRLGLAGRISWPLPLELSIPAVGQGALGVEARAEAVDLLARLAALDHAPTRACVTAERAAQLHLRGGCAAPFGAHALLEGERLTLLGILSDPDGSRWVTRILSGPPGDPTALGLRLAEELIASGGAELLTAD
jgi:hydroxymethylbilane synthase